MQDSEIGGSLVVFQNGQGIEMKATVVRMTRHQVVFEVCSAQEVLRSSEVLSRFTILVQERPIYSGSAVITAVVNTGLALVCEARLDDQWCDLDLAGLDNGGNLAPQYAEFVARWQRLYKIEQQYKTVIADIDSFLVELHSWLQQVELGIRSLPSGDRNEAEAKVIQNLEPATLISLTELFRRFEAVAENVEAALRPAHEAFARRHLQSFVLTAPFGFRTFRKPLGYAGDYEMVNMMARSPYEGGSLFAKLFNAWLLQQPPAEAHRNRINYLEQKLKEETARVGRLGRRARILSLGCGPAMEVQRLLSGWAASSQCEIVLMDFNEETITHTRTRLTELAREHKRATSFTFLRKSVQQILKEANKSALRGGEQAVDFVYCAGLFDYIPDYVCQCLTAILYRWVAPGGLLLCTNVTPGNPFRQCMETFLDWRLVYRNSPQMQKLRPTDVDEEGFSVKSDMTGVNLFMELRKPADGK